MTQNKLEKKFSPCLFCPSKPIPSSGICDLCYFYRIKKKIKVRNKNFKI